MANVKFCFPNWTQPTSIYTPTAAGFGSPDLWVDLDNLQSEVLSEMARYPGVDPADTKILIDLRTARNIGALAMPFHNAQDGDLGRIRIASDAALTDILYDSGWIDFIGEIYPYGSLPSERVEWIDGRMTAEQSADRMIPWIDILPADVYGRYLEIQLDFTDNTDGYVDIGRIFASPIISPTVNTLEGTTPPFYHDPSTKSRTRRGPSFSDKRKPYRLSRLTFGALDLDEVYEKFFEMVRQYGLSEPFFFIYNSDADKYILIRQSFVATADNVAEPKNSHYGIYAMDLEISEQF